MNNEVFVTISLMAAATIFTRLGGLWLMGRVKISPLVERWLKNLPGSLMIAIITPGILTGRLAESLAAAAVILVMLLNKNVMVAMAAGVVVVFLVRNYLQGVI